MSVPPVYFSTSNHLPLSLCVSSPLPFFHLLPPHQQHRPLPLIPTPNITVPPNRFSTIERFHDFFRLGAVFFYPRLTPQDSFLNPPPPHPPCKVYEHNWRKLTVLYPRNVHLFNFRLFYSSPPLSWDLERRLRDFSPLPFLSMSSRKSYSHLFLVGLSFPPLFALIPFSLKMCIRNHLSLMLFNLG